MRKLHWVAVVSVVTATSSGVRADAASAAEKLLRGDYEAAITDARGAQGNDRPIAQLVLAQALRAQGNYPEAEAALLPLLQERNRAVADAAAVRLAELHRLRGKLAEAVRLVEPIAKADKKAFRARIVQAIALFDQGKVKEAGALFELFYDHYQDGTIDTNDAEQLLYVGQAARYLTRYQDANDAFNDAVVASPPKGALGLAPQAYIVEANLEWGTMLIDKYHAGTAAQGFEEVLKANPNHPEAHVGMARVKLEESYDIASAHQHIKSALKVNPHHADAHVVLALIAIDRNEWDLAGKEVAAALAVNPGHLEALSLAATVAWLRDDLRTYETYRQKVLALNPMYARFFHIVARSAVREHRYREAIELEKAALKVDPKYYEAMEGIGSGYLRLGDEAEGLKWLRESWGPDNVDDVGDKYNARTYNLLELYEQDIPSQYSFASSKSFRIRYHNDEKKSLRRYIEPLLETAFADMVKRYGFTPKTPVILELYNDPDQYSVRTVGLPNLGALGVCFGQVITASSPSDGNINWGMVLWHELAHVFHIQLSNSRVPRWFTEGLAEYETLRARPEWRRENDADLWAAVQANALPSVATLSHEFMKPSMQKVVVAYHLSSVVMEYIATRYGFGKIVEALKLFGKGKETPDVIPVISGVSVAEFDKQFREYLLIRLAPYKGTYSVPELEEDITQLEIAVDAAKSDPQAKAKLALGYFYEGEAEKALAIAEEVLAKEPANRIALYVSAEIYIRTKQVPRAKDAYLKLIAAGGDSADVRGRLALIAQQTSDKAGFVKQLNAMKRLNPESGEPYTELAEFYEAEGKHAEALLELEHYVVLEQMQYDPLQTLVEGYSKLKQWDKARYYGELAILINPFDGYMFLSLGDAYLQTGEFAKALYQFESALAATPALRRPALAEIGRARAFRGMNDKANAKKAIAAALGYEPTHAEALALRDELK